MWPRPRPDSCGHGHAAGRDQRRQRQRDLVADAAGGVLVGGRPRQRGEVHPLPRRDHRGGPAGDLAAVHAVEQDRHRQRRHLLVGDLAARVGVDHPVDLAVAQLAAVALGEDDLDGVVGGMVCSCMASSHGHRCGSPAARTCPGSPARRPAPGRGTASNSAVSDSTSSIRASGAPRQKCTPTPKARCGLGSRSTWNSSGSVEDRRVAVGRAEQRRDLLALLDRDVADLDVLGGGALEELQRRVEAQHLLHGQRDVGARAAARAAASRPGRCRRR